MSRIICYIIPFLILLSSCNQKKYPYLVWLDQIPFDIIVNQYGPPEKNLSYGRNSITLKGEKYARGIGTHAPSDLSVNIRGMSGIFEAIIGVDSEIETYRKPEERKKITSFPSYIYDGNGDNTDYRQGGTIIFSVYADNVLVYKSKVMNETSTPERIRLKLKNINTLRLVTDPTDDGSFADHANWAMASFRFAENISPSSLFLFSFPAFIMLNQAGYKSDSYKSCIMSAEIIDSIYIYNSTDDRLVYKNTINLSKGDFGKYLTADFSAFKTPGTYYMKSAGKISAPFEISDTIYKNLLSSQLYYISTIKTENLQTSGVEEQNMVASSKVKIESRWFDACSVKELANSSALMLYSLSLLYEHVSDPIMSKQILNELRHGNQYLLSLQNSLGYITEHINCENEKEDLIQPVKSICNDERDTVIHSAQASMLTQFLFTLSQARLIRFFAEDSDYQSICRQAALNSFSWAYSNLKGKEDAGTLGAAITAATELYLTEKNEIYKRAANEFVAGLLSLAHTSKEKPFGFFKTSVNDSIPVSAQFSAAANWPLAGLCTYLKVFPNSTMAEECKDVIRNYCNSYISHFAGKNVFGLIPYGVYTNNRGGYRIAGDYYYRYFGEPINSFNHSGGTIAHITSTGAGLVMASEILNDPELIGIAQKQLDWVLGCNPFNTSFITGFGYNQPALYNDPGVSHITQAIKGGVMTGISGDFHDNPVLLPGWKQSGTYSVIAAANTMWLTILLDK